MTGLAQPCSMQPLIIQQASQVDFHGSSRVPRKRESTQDPLRPGFRTGAVSISLVFSGLNKSQGQPRFKAGGRGGEQTLPLLEESRCKVKIKGICGNQVFLFAVGFLP